mmetsp:Transcript_70917/g.125330  ORF Transcript_70917/g.125330 Transcript_70917/m.125330 type:complete len:287 (+) Transcript_70917:996-1856(+)
MKSFSITACKKVPHARSRKVEGIRSRHQRQESLLLHRVIQNLCLAAILLSSHALVAHCGVTHCNGTSSAQDVTTNHDYLNSNEGHGGVRSCSTHLRSCILTTFMKCRIAHCHVSTRYPHMVEAEKAIVLVVVANLRSDVAYNHSLQWSVSVTVTDLDHEIMDTKVMTSHKQAGIDDGMIGCFAKGSRPPFRTCCGWAMDLNLIGFREICCSCFETTNIAAVSKLCLRIATDYLPRLGLWQPIQLLLITESRADVWQKHQMLQISAQVIVHYRSQHCLWNLQLSRQL